jgi:hypothetical protein
LFKPSELNHNLKSCKISTTFLPSTRANVIDAHSHKQDYNKSQPHAKPKRGGYLARRSNILTHFWSKYTPHAAENEPTAALPSHKNLQFSFCKRAPRGAPSSSVRSAPPPPAFHRLPLSKLRPNPTQPNLTTPRNIPAPPHCEDPPRTPPPIHPHVRPRLPRTPPYSTSLTARSGPGGRGCRTSGASRRSRSRPRALRRRTTTT